MDPDLRPSGDTGPGLEDYRDRTFRHAHPELVDDNETGSAYENQNCRSGVDELAGTRINSTGGIIIVHRAKSEGNAHTTTVEQIYCTIDKNPGVTYSDIIGKVGKGNGTVSYHLSNLQKDRRVVSKKCQRYRRYWTAGYNGLKDTSSLSERCRKIVCLLEENGRRLTISEIAAMLCVKHPTVCYHLRILEMREIVCRKKSGRKTVCHLMI